MRGAAEHHGARRTRARQGRLSRAGGVIVENLTRLEALHGVAHPVVSVLPLHLPGADGAPTRAVAMVETS